MKIAIGGKGGTGKTTLAGTLARVLAQAGRSVVAIDADSNPNLASIIGFTDGEISELEPLPRDLLEPIETDGVRRLVLRETTSDVISEHAVVGPDGVRLLMGARVGHAGAG